MSKESGGRKSKLRRKQWMAIGVKKWKEKREKIEVNALPMSLYTILKESECRWPKNCPWIIDEYFRINLRYLKLFFSEYVVWPFGMIPICLSSLLRNEEKDVNLLRTSFEHCKLTSQAACVLKENRERIF